MSGRKRPIATGLNCSVIYPSELYALEYDEVYPYERFAHNVFEVGIQVLNKKGLPESLTVDFSKLLPGCAPWAINASAQVIRNTQGDVQTFLISTPELTPACFYLFAKTVGVDFLDEEKFCEFQTDPAKLVKCIQLFADAASAGVREYKKNGIGHAVRASYEHLNCQVLDLHICGEVFDLMAKQVAYHEVAHAYAGHLILPRSNHVERLACELIADCIATMWFCGKMVLTTPDSDEYRAYKKLNTFQECICANALIAQRAQQLNLIMAALSGAQLNGGRSTLAGGASHPPGLWRYIHQTTILEGTIMGDFKDVLTEEQKANISQDWATRMGVLFKSGVIPAEDGRQLMLDKSQAAVFEKAADIIEDQHIPEIDGLSGSLRATSQKIKT